jgi:Cof subfamily protein (haloacid dehalogenase superfamily)
MTEPAADGAAGRPIAMIGTDIDGTMLRPDGSLSPRVKRSLHDAADAGVHVVPATGRPAVIARDVIEALEMPDYWVFANGAITRHLGRDELIRGFWLDDDFTRSMIEVLRESLPAAGFALEFEQSVAYENGFEAVVPTLPPVDPIDDVLDALRPTSHPTPGHPERIQKVLVYDLNVDLDDLFVAVSEAVGDQAVACYSGLPFIELAAGQVTKATALGLLADDLGVDPADVAVFGDNHNDLPMLQWAGHSYAMGNATDDAKEAADETIGTNDQDGLADKIDELIAGR